MTEPLQLYAVLDAFLEQIGDQEITDEIRRTGILMPPSKAAWFLANGLLALFEHQSGPVRPPKPSKPQPMTQILAPTLTRGDDGRTYILRALSGMLIVVEFKPEDYVPPDDPGDLTLWFKNALV